MRKIKTLYNFSVKRVDGTEEKLSNYEGKVILIVNTASKCGFTPQFAELQQLYEKYEKNDFVILGFPCDQFQNQEFSNIDETIEFCQVNYGVTFPMFAKVNVNGQEAHPLYAFLKEQKKGILTSSIKWNFTKFLIDGEGRVIQRYAPIKRIEQIEKDIKAII